MNTLAKLYKETQSFFYTHPESPQAQMSLVNLVSAFVSDPHPFATVDIIAQKKLKEADLAYWQTLKDYGLQVVFTARKHSFAFVTLQALPLQTPQNLDASVTEQTGLKAAA